MASNKWNKRIMKVKGWFLRLYSFAALRYTRWNTKLLEKQLFRFNVDKLHAGCGHVHLDGWLNIFYEPREEYGRVHHVNGKLLLNYNLLKPWPVPENSVQFIAASHFIEHLDLNDGIRFVQNSFRVLKPGGVIRLSCPDLEIYARHYMEGNKAFFEHKLIREWCTFKQAQTPGQILAAKAYDSGGSHKWFYDFESLKNILEVAGFKEIKKCQRLEGQMPRLEDIELAQRELESVYIEGVKY